MQTTAQQDFKDLVKHLYAWLELDEQDKDNERE